MVYEDLTGKARERAKEYILSHSLDDGWWRPTYDWIYEVGEALGVTFNDIVFSGFYSQGDGAQFIGEWEHRPDAIELIKVFAPDDKVLLDIAEALNDVVNGPIMASEILLGERDDYALLARVSSTNSHHCHEMATSIEVIYLDNSEYAPDEVDSDIAKQLRKFMRWMYRALEDEHDYLQSDNCVAALAEWCEFTEEGTPITEVSCETITKTVSIQ